MVERDKAIHNTITAEEVFNWGKNDLLPSRKGNFAADFFNNNHVLEALPLDIYELSYLERTALESFITSIIRFPQIQIPTVSNIEGNKRMLSLPEIMEQHGSIINEIVESQGELAYQAGDEARIQSLRLLDKSIGLNSIETANQAYITLAGSKYTPHALIPLFNITTAAKIAFDSGIPLPQELTALQSTSFPQVPNGPIDERYF